MTILELNRKSVEPVNARSKSDKIFFPELLHGFFY